MTQTAVTAAAIALLTMGANAQVGMTDTERQRLLSHLDMTRAWLVDEVSGLSNAQLTFKPSRDAWSIAQVLEHLVMVGPIYWNDLQQALTAPPGDPIPRDTDADILWYGIDRTQREQALATEIPQGKARDLETLLGEHRRHHDRLRNYVRTTTDDLRRHLVPRQGSDAYQWVLLISTHEQRHILQIRDIKAAPGFPARVRGLGGYGR